MTELMDNLSLMVLITGLFLVLTMLIRHLLSRTLVPPLVGYLLLGFVLRFFQDHTAVFPQGHEAIFAFLGKVGLVTLLFRVGLESKLSGLMKEFFSAGMISVVNVIGSAFGGFLVAFYLLNLGWITSLVIAVAFTSTSVGVSIQVWEDAKLLDTPQGSLLLDLAELDSISAVVLMALLFNILPTLVQDAGQSGLLMNVAGTIGWFVVKFSAFIAFCICFSRYFEPAISGFLRRVERVEGYMLSITGLGFVIAAVAGLLGFSLAIGAFFAGLLFSRDPEAVKDEAPFVPIYDFFSPFFFINIGLQIDPTGLQASLWLGLLLLVFAVLFKVISNGGPAWALRDLDTGVLIGASMVPRAEVAMIVMEHSTRLDNWTIPKEVFSAMILVCAVSCLISPVVIHTLLNGRFNPRENA